MYVIIAFQCSLAGIFIRCVRFYFFITDLYCYIVIVLKSIIQKSILAPTHATIMVKVEGAQRSYSITRKLQRAEFTSSQSMMLGKLGGVTRMGDFIIMHIFVILPVFNL